MRIEIPVLNQKDRWFKYLSFLAPLTKVSNENDLQLLSALCTLYSRYSSYKSDNLYSLLFSSDTKRLICKNLGISEKSFEKSFQRLKNLNIIQDNKINQKILYPVFSGKFDLNIIFKESKVNEEVTK